MARSEFIEQARALGFDVHEHDTVKIYFQYTVPVGRNIGQKILIGFEVGDDFPMNSPPGPHIKTLDSGWIEHPQNVHDSPFNGVLATNGWRYWSRPFKDWNRSERTVKAYFGHIKNVFMTV